MVWTYHHYEIGDNPLLFGYSVYIHLFFFLKDQKRIIANYIKFKM